MRKSLLIILLVGLAGVIGVLLVMPVRTAATAHSSQAPRANASIRPPDKSAIRPPTKTNAQIPMLTGDTPLDAKRPDDPLSHSPSGTGPELATIPLNEKPLARINGVPLMPSQIFPPGVMRAGDQMPKIALDKFLNDAVNRAVLVQEAERRGYAETPEFTSHMNDLRGDIEELPDLSPETRAWQLNELRDMALMDRVFREEGIVPRRLTDKEVESYYQAHSAEYDWVRKRETLKGRPAEKIELRVVAEMRKDLQIPIKRQLSQKRDEFTAALRQNANVEILSATSSEATD